MAATKGRARAGTARPARPAKGRPAPDQADLALSLARIEARLEGLQAEVAALRGAAPVASGAAAGLGSLARDLQAGLETLHTSLGEVPRAQDFEPLADHLYAFAELAPRLIDGLESVQRAVGPVEAAASTLGQVVDTLMAIHQSWSESLLRLPRAEDYEPLAAPLREFARVSPVLAETLGAVVRAVTPLPEVAAQLSKATHTLRELGGGARAAGGDEGLRPAVVKAAEEVGAALAAIRSALASLPKDPAYARFAAQLRELATVSPSLLDWLGQVPTLSLPLGEAVASLDEAAQNLEEAEGTLRQALTARAPRPRKSP